MVKIKHILQENGVLEKFYFIVLEGNNSGTYEIKKPDGWNALDSIININEEFMYIEDFIIGESNKMTFSQFTNPIAFDILSKVYSEQGGDGRVLFKWIAVKDGIEYDLLKDNFEINFNKFSKGFDKTTKKIDLEIIKSDAQNKLFNRDDITIDLFEEKDLDDKTLDAVPTFDIGFKKGNKILENFYFATAGQERGNLTNESNKFYVFSRSEENDFGNSGNPQSGVASENNGTKQAYFGSFIYADITLKNVKFSFSNFNIGIYTDNINFFSDVYIYLVITLNGNVQNIQIPSSKAIDGTFNWDGTTYKGGVMNFGNIEFKLDKALEIGSTVDIWFVSPSNTKFKTILLKEEASISISTNLDSPIVKTKGVRLIDSINQIVKSYTSSELSVISNHIGVGGTYYNTSISTGLYLRGLPSVYLSQKMKTSFKDLFQNGVAKLLALGFDVQNDNVIVEDLPYFFKDVKVYDLSNRVYLQDDYSTQIDKDLIFNSLLFGSKKYSTNTKDDIRNFNTEMEVSTPIKSLKNKFDKQTSLIIDEFKIQELIEDNTTKTNNSDDDLVLIDMVNVTDFWDSGVFENTSHSNDAGNLSLSCFTTPFDTTLMSVGGLITISEGLNVGTWTILSISGAKIRLNKTTGIQEGVQDTVIKYNIQSLTKNRTNDGFTDIANVRNTESSTNMRHNPKYQMARWFQWFGSGLRKKLNSDILKVTNYKNNDIATMKANSQDLVNELDGVVVVGENENLGRLRSYNQTFFNGDKITIAYPNITFEEFINIYELWKYGENNDRLKSRGYLELNTPLGIYDVFPYGKEAFKHNKQTNLLTINARIKGKSTANPTLLNVNQIDKTTVLLTWDFNDDYVNATTDVQYSLDGVNWTTIKQIDNVKTTTIQSDLFLSIFTGSVVYFRVSVSSSDYYGKISNTLQIDWQFNNYTYKEISRIIDNACGVTYLTFELSGNDSFTIDWRLLCFPSGGTFLVTDQENNIILDVNTVYGGDYDDTVQTTLVLNNETVTYTLQMKTTDNDGDRFINCLGGNNLVLVTAEVIIKITDSQGFEINNSIKSVATKRYRTGQEPIPPPLTPTV